MIHERRYLSFTRGLAGPRAARLLLAGAFAAFLSLTACGGSDDDVSVDRGPTTMEVEAKLNGLFWDPEESRLYFTDDSTNTIGTWSDDEGFGAPIDLPAMEEGQRATLGQLVRGDDGVLYTTRFGFSEYGTLVAVPPSGEPYNVTGMDPEPRRIGIAKTADGSMIDTWFTDGHAGGTGVISEVTIQGQQASEQPLVTGLDKPVGVAAVGDDLFISDQSSGELRRYSLNELREQPATAAEGDLMGTFNDADGVDLMTAATDGTLYFGSGGGTLFRVDPHDGTVTELATGWPGIRGVALDESGGRLFAAVAAPDDESPSSIRIIPLD